jgi:hypothetical protein
VEVLFALVIVAAVAAFVMVPLRRAETGDDDTALEAELADLEARKQAKYREIRDTELDHASGKLSDADFETQDAELRAEAIGILKRLDELGKRRPAEEGSPEPDPDPPGAASP